MVENKIEKILKNIKTLVCIERKYDLSKHARDYITKNLSSYIDIEYCIQNAITIHGIAKDGKGTAIDGNIYTIRGWSRDGAEFYTTGKFKIDLSGENGYFFITAHRLMETGDENVQL